MKKLFTKFFIFSYLAFTGITFSQSTIINENIQSWTNHASYGNYTQSITVESGTGTVNMTDCIVANGAAATGTCTTGRVQLKATTGILELPTVSSISYAEFHLAAGAAGRTVTLQSYDGTNWNTITTFSGIGTTGATFTYAVNSSSPTTIRLANPSAALYVHDIIIKDNSGLPVELNSFTAFAGKSGVQLNWSTATEVNNYGFDIERCVAQISNLCNNWEKIGFVAGHGNSNSPKDYTFVDAYPPAGKVLYKLKQIDFDGAFEYSKAVEVNVETPKEFRLAQNYPNPFNPSTVISYQLPMDGNVTLKVYDMLGKEVTTLVNEFQRAGSYNYQFSINNLQLSSGVYYYRLQSGNFVQTKKFIVMK